MQKEGSRQDYDLVGSYDNQRITTINAERTVNLFEYMDPQGKRPKVLLPTAGLVDTQLNFSTETMGSRAAFVFNNSKTGTQEIYLVYGSSVFRVTGSTDALTTSKIGTFTILVNNIPEVTTTTGYVGVDANQYQIIFVDGVAGWIWDTNSETWRQITDTGFPTKPIDVCYLDGFFVIANGNTNNFQLSAINQGMVWSGGSATFTANAATDILTLSTSSANFATGVPVTLTRRTVAVTFTADAATDIFTLNAANIDFPTGTAVKFKAVGTLPSPLNATDVYYTIAVSSSSASPGTIMVATTLANAMAGVAIDLTTNGAGKNTVFPVSTFTGDAGLDLLTLNTSNADFQTGTSLKFSTTGTLPNPLNTTDTFYSIAVSPTSTIGGTIRVATTYANAIAGTYIDLTTNGTPTNSVVSSSSLPAPLTTTTTYYVIRLGTGSNNDPTDPGKIKLALSYEDAIVGTAIDITTNGAPINTITVSGQLQLGSITSHPGTIVACRTLHRRIFFFSQNYTEVWENAGLGANLPFRRNNSLLMEVGTPAIASVQVGFDRMFFLAQDNDGLAGIMEVRGTESLLVSNRALEYQLSQYALTPGVGVNDAWGILIKENGLIFYRLNFTHANHTFVLNVSMSTAESPKWHEEETLEFNRHPAQTHAYFGGVNYYGDYAKPLFYTVDDTVSTNNGEAIRRMRIGRQMTPEGYNRLRIDRFQVDLLQGAEDILSLEDIDLWTEDSITITTESKIDIILETQEAISSDNNPVVFLQISRDGGQTFGNHLIAKMGKVGERTYRTVWRKLGTTPRGQGFVPKIEFYNNIPFVVLGASWDFENMPE